MLALSNAQRQAITLGGVMLRYFIWCEARDPDTGSPAPAGFWNDVGDIVDGPRTYHGSGSLISISSLTAKGDLTKPKLTVSLSGLDVVANEMLRGRSIAQAPIEVHLGVYVMATQVLIPPLISYFIGFVDDVSIPTPPKGGDSVISIICRSASSALDAGRTSTRSLASSAERDPADDFYSDTGAQRKPLYFGRAAPASAGQGGAGARR
jgi:hypothetical protein